MTTTEESFLLSHVVNQGDIAATQSLLSEASAIGIDVNSINSSGETALFVAIRRCLPAMVELLLRFGADPQIASDERCGKQTPLHLATELDQCSTIAMLLSVGGANPNTVDAQKQTALHIACRLGHVSSARMLIAHGTNLLAEDSLGRSALRLAETSAKCSPAHAEITSVLLKAIADAHGTAYVEENNLKVDETAVAAAGGPIALLAANQPVKVSGVPILPSGMFMQQARQVDQANIAWVNSSTISGQGKKKKPVATTGKK